MGYLVIVVTVIEIQCTDALMQWTQFNFICLDKNEEEKKFKILQKTVANTQFTSYNVCVWYLCALTIFMVMSCVFCFVIFYCLWNPCDCTHKLLIKSLIARNFFNQFNLECIRFNDLLTLQKIL